MPCYLFTYHGHGTWLPDHARGYVRRKARVLAPDAEMARNYRANLTGEAVCFDQATQKVLIAAALEAFQFQTVRGHGIATESTHVHILVSWRTDHTWEIVRRRLRNSLTRQLNAAFGKREWFAKQPSRKRVADRRHFNHLMQTYLPRHSGLKWREGVGVYT
jgi:hypothetical protein